MQVMYASVTSQVTVCTPDRNQHLSQGREQRLQGGQPLSDDDFPVLQEELLQRLLRCRAQGQVQEEDRLMSYLSLNLINSCTNRLGQPDLDYTFPRKRAEWHHPFSSGPDRGGEDVESDGCPTIWNYREVLQNSRSLDPLRD